MRSLVFVAPDAMEIRDTPEPVPGPEDVLVRVDAVGICGSDLHAYKGHDPRRVPPMTLGHEFVGTVLDGKLAGRRFTANPLVVCGRCQYCAQGRTNLCSDRTMIGMSRPGAFAERLAVPLSCLVPVPDGVSDRAAALTEPAATVVHALHLGERAATRPLAEARALVLGAGAIGLLAVLALQKRGVAVSVVETNPLRAGTLARATGLAPTPPGDAGEGRFDFVFDAVGVAATRDLAIRAAAAGGVVVHAGLGDWTTPLDWRGLTLREITLIGCYTYTTADLGAAIALLGSGGFGALDWVEERPLDAGAAAFAELAAGRVASPKVLLRPR
jgi:2-desacetyl-2-hydroxyethyl bacteriochlorophyllide A dehydrogenase